MEKTTALKDRTPQADAASDPWVVLDGMISTLQSAESAIASLQAMREYTLAMASRLAEVMGRTDAVEGISTRFADSGWNSVELAQRAVAAEIATAIRANDRTIQLQMGQAVELLERFPATFDALAQGKIGMAHVRVIQDVGTVLETPEALARYEAAALECAEQQAPTRLRRLAFREAEKAQPQAIAARHERAVAGRCVRVTSLPDGMAELAAVLPAAVAHGIHDRLTQMAKAHSAEEPKAGCAGTPLDGSSRTIDQLRADLLSDLLLCGAPAAHDTPDGLLAAITARVDITVPVLTLIDGDGSPAELNGQHPIDPATAEILAGQAIAWNRVLTHPVTGAVLSVDRYRPSEDLKRLLAARDTRCRFPGCGIKARDLDLDHTHDAAFGGATDAGNLAGVCRRHHMLKHHSRWKVRQTGAGILEWTSPTGRRYTDHPPTPATHVGGVPRSAGVDSHDGGEPPPF